MKLKVMKFPDPPENIDMGLFASTRRYYKENGMKQDVKYVSIIAFVFVVLVALLGSACNKFNPAAPSDEVSSTQSQTQSVDKLKLTGVAETPTGIQCDSDARYTDVTVNGEEVFTFTCTNMPPVTRIEKGHGWDSDPNRAGGITASWSTNGNVFTEQLNHNTWRFGYLSKARPCVGVAQPDVSFWFGDREWLALAFKVKRLTPLNGAVCNVPPPPPPTVESCPAGLDVQATKNSRAFSNLHGSVVVFVKAGYSVSVSAAAYDGKPEDADLYGYGWVNQRRVAYSGLRTIVGPAQHVITLAVGGANQWDLVCGDSPERLDSSNQTDYQNRTITYKLKTDNEGAEWESWD